MIAHPVINKSLGNPLLFYDFIESIFTLILGLKRTTVDRPGQLSLPKSAGARY
jgi:hypothetical protein